MSQPIESFNLLDEPWIQALALDGTVRELSLLDLFRQAPRLREIVGDLPTQGFAILRVALAALHRAVNGPPDMDAWDALWDADGPPITAIEEYLERHRDRFDLVHPRTPFFQVADLHTSKNEFSGLEKLVADVPAGRPFFTTRIGRGLTRLSFAEAARWLVHLQAYDISGIKSGAVGDDRVKNGKGYPIGTGWAGAIGGIVVEGENLWRTLLLNLIPRGEPGLVLHSDADRPAWESQPSTAAESPDRASRPYGPLDLFTWQSRRVRLRYDADGVTGVLVCNGDKITPQNRYRVEPMTAWRRSTPQEKALKLPLVYMPRSHDPSRALWRGLGQFLPLAADRGKTDDGLGSVTAGVLSWAGIALESTDHVQVRAVGMTYGTQNAAVDDVVDDRLPLSVALLATTHSRLPRTAIDAVDATDAGVLALRNLASNLVKAAGGTDDRLIDGARARAAEVAYAALDVPFRSWLRDIGPDTDPEQARLDWHTEARRILRRLGEELTTAAGPAAWTGREISGRRITTPEAEAWFRAALVKALPVPRLDPSTHTDTPPQEDVA